MADRPTTRPAGLKDVAALAGVSLSTASRVLRGDLGFVGAQTAEKVCAAAQELRYHPSASARALARGKTLAVAVAYQYPNLGHFQTMLAAARRAIENHGYRMIHLAIESDGDVVPSTVLAERRADVLLLAGVSGAYEALDWIVEPHQKVVAVGAFTPDALPPIPTAYWDDREGIMAAVEHLADLGHERVTYLGGFAGGKDAIFEVCAASRGLNYAIEVSDVFGVTAWMADGAAMARRALARSPRPTALVARNDDIAIGALHTIAECGLRVPEDVSIVGYFNTPIGPFCRPALTSVDTPFAECAKAVIERALLPAGEEPGTPAEPTFVKYPTRLVARRSSSSPA